MHQILIKGFLKHRIKKPHPGISDLVHLGGDLIFYIPYSLPSNVATAGPGTTLRITAEVTT